MQQLKLVLYNYRNPMILSWGFFMFFVFQSIPFFSQHIIQKQWTNSSIEKVSIVSDKIFAIRVVTHAKTEIQLEATIAGDFSESIVLEASEGNSILSLDVGYRPYFKEVNDKLAAHKVMAVEFDLYLPKSFALEVVSNTSSLEINGPLQRLDAQLQDGIISLRSFEGNASLQTKSGTINVLASKITTGEAFSASGTIENTLSNKGFFKIKARTENGDIHLSHSTE